MNKMSRLISCLTVICILAGMMVSVSATGDANVVIGEKLVFEEGNEPFISNERTMMPLRAVAEALDATVYWFNDDKHVQIVLYDTLLSLNIGHGVMGKYKIENGKANSETGESIVLDAPAMIYNDRTYVPLRAISEAFDATITWDNPNRAAIIIPSEKQTNDVMVSEMAALPSGTLCSGYGVIDRDMTTGVYYLRALTRNSAGEYAKIAFCTPSQTSMSEDTEYGLYVSQYWLEQFGLENPSGMVIRFTGVTAMPPEATSNCIVLSKTTTGIRSYGHYDEYMKSLGLDYEPFVNLAIQ